ncbi:DUF4082 domain-containing protein [Pedococcus sp. 5OH_020]|uniref:DUF4082 domain-containing protein n=1 Tax=Pedococcus sp. 5OH_020 TaxID=2989814 RepID=UPI0022E9E08E|nr:DUF4082 domain-containing protein [Pedococcus sp. 5OH_020]
MGRRVLAAIAAFAAGAVGPLALVQTPAGAAGPCGPPVVSVVACENTQTGDPASDWEITGAGSTSIQGFATSMSVNAGQTVQFKVNTPSTSYHFDILRLGYYQGNGARKVAANLRPSATLPQSQPPCLAAQDSTGLIDCGNWGVSASWTVPSTAVSGVYIAHLVRDDATGGSHITFVVRNDAGHSDVLFQTSDQTWQAYNTYGGNSLYSCATNCPPGSPAAYKGASKVSYNRPFHTAEDDQGGRSWLMYAEYPMIRFLEQNGYDVAYTSGLDTSTAAGGALLTNHKVFMSTGHDEYWSGVERTNVEAARDAGVSLAFFSGNEVFWKTRFEPSIDGTSTPNRTLVCYKETHYDGVVDPKDPPTWTGTWQDPRFSPPGDGGKPQNALTGQLFMVNSGTTDIRVPAQYSALRFWRNTAVASLGTGQTLTLGSGLGTLGYEWDVDPDNGFRPAGTFRMSSTTTTSAEVFTDYGSTTITPGTATHNLTLYRAPSGALVFGAGTVQWSWGLGDPQKTPDRNMQQATVNLFADMGAQPYALATGLTLATVSADKTAPTSAVTSPAANASIGDGAKLTVSGTAADTGGGVVAGVEVSTDGGTTWHPATGTTSWTYSWVAHGRPTATIKTRAVDDSGNVEVPSAGTTVNVGCTCSIFGVGSAPTTAATGPAGGVEVGVKFKSDASGVVTGLRFYKASTNTGTHIGNLWSSSGTKLASVTFSNESTSGWQQATFSSPVAINANSTYVASYFAPTGHTALDDMYFYANPSPGPYASGSVDSPPLHALRNANGTLNGMFQDSSTSTFPTDSDGATNYWVDVMFNPNTGPATAPGAPTTVTATPGNASAQVSWTTPSDGGSPITSFKVTPYIGTTAQTPTTVPGNPPDTTVTINGLSNGTAYTFTVSATNAVGTSPVSASSNPVTPTETSCTACTIWSSTTVPNTTDQGDPGSIELGTKFKADANGQIKGIRFYKSTANTGTHIGSLWTSAGTKLASATFSNETPSGWQQVNFASPVTITAGTVYVASYFAPAGHYASDTGYFAASGVDNGALHALRDGVSGGNGVYRYGTSSVFPNSTFNSEGYYVDVVYSTVPASAPAAPSNVTATAGNATATVSWTAPSDGGSTITSYTVTPYIGGSAQTSTTVSGSPPATTATFTGLTNDTAYTFRVSATNDVGTGPVSAASPAVTPSAPHPPGAPTNVTATAGNGSATVSWTAPSNGGSAITSYTVTPYLGSTAQTPTTVTGSPPAASTTVLGLTNGTAYTFTVSATNALGTGAESAPSDPVTPTGTTTPAAPTGVAATAGDASAVVTWTAPPSGDSAVTSYTVTPYIGSTAQSATTVSGSPPATTATVNGLTNGTAYTFTVSATNAVGSGPDSAHSAPVTPAAVCTACTIWPSSATPASPSIADTSPVELGVKFKTDVNGSITGIRFYKGTGNTGTHVGALWSASGTKLASVTFTGESASGWQQATFATAVPVTAGTVYVASYFAPAGHYAGDGGYFATGIDGDPLNALQDGVSGGNGVYGYSATASTFPSNSFNSTNYWVDVVFSNAPAAAPVVPAAPTGVTATGGDASAAVSWTAPADGGSAITRYTVTPYVGSTAQAATTVSGSPPATTATVTGLTNGTAYTFKVSATNAVGTGAASASSSPVTPAATTCTACTIWPSTASPTNASTADGSPVEVGVKFTSDVSGSVTGIRFYKGTGNTGTHVGSLWSATGTRLASVTFTGEAASGWQQATFATPVAITAGTVYVASYFAPVGHYAGDGGYFTTAVDNAPLHALKDGTSGGNGVYAYAGTSTFPSNTFNAGNYWVDVLFSTSSPPAATAPAAPSGVTATAGDASAAVSWTAPADGGSAITRYTVTPYVGSTAQAATTVSGSPPATTTTVTGLTNGTAYTFKVSATNAVGTGAASASSSPVTPAATTCTACTIWPSTAAPANPTNTDSSSVELGVKFTSDVSGSVTGIRFYKGTGNTGTHLGSLWSATGTRLASVTFTGETASGWQQATFATPVAITAGTVYVASYFAPVGHYAGDGGYFTSAVDRAPLHALKDGTSGGNGVYGYAGSSGFPTSTFNGANYWVDVLFSTSSPPAATAPAAPTGVTATAGNASAAVSWTAPADGGSAITSYTVTPYVGSTAQAATTVSGSPPATTATVTGLTNGTAYTFKVSATNAVGTGALSAASGAVTPAAPTCTDCTIWAATATPATADVADPSSVELGVKFTSDVSGSLTGIRFYKGPGNTGTHVGSLWSATGTRLASVTFTGETASGWQQATFATPVAITAGTVYVASYFAPVGHYSANGAYFTTAVDNGPLHALKDGVAGGNGVYGYGASSVFPTETFNAANYWVDVLFSTG